MKKVSMLIIGLLFVFPFTVLAADPQVSSVDASASGTTISYSGTTEDGLTAVMCKLFDGDTEVKKVSSSVDNNSFSGQFIAPSNGTYKVSCARYEGGTIKSTEVVVKDNTSTSTDTSTTDGTTTVSTDTETAKSSKTSSNPKTYDEGILKSLIILSISVVGIISTVVVLKKRSTVKSN